MSAVDILTGVLCMVFAAALIALWHYGAEGRPAYPDIPTHVRWGLYFCGLGVIARGFELIKLSGPAGTVSVAGHADVLALAVTVVMVFTFVAWAWHIARHRISPRVRPIINHLAAAPEEVAEVIAPVATVAILKAEGAAKAIRPNGKINDT